MRHLVPILNTIGLIVILAYLLSFTPLFSWMDDNLGLPTHETILEVTNHAH